MKFIIILSSVLFVIFFLYWMEKPPNFSTGAGFATTVELVRGADYATLKVEVDATMTDVVRSTITDQVIDSVLHAECDLIRNKKPQVCNDYQSQWTTIMVQLDYQ